MTLRVKLETTERQHGNLQKMLCAIIDAHGIPNGGGLKVLRVPFSTLADMRQVDGGTTLFTTHNLIGDVLIWRQDKPRFVMKKPPPNPEIFCPFSTTHACPGDCSSQAERACVNGP